VLDLRFEDSPDTGLYANSTYPTHGPLRVQQGSGGAGALSSTQAHEGVQSYHQQLRPLAASGTTDLTIGTADFQIKLYMYFVTHAGAESFGWGLFGFDTAGIQPTMYLAHTTHVLHFSNNGALDITNGSYVPALNVWIELMVRRVAGVTTLYADRVALVSIADTSNYVAGTTFRIGCFGNTAGPHPNVYIDEVTINNSNV